MLGRFTTTGAADTTFGADGWATTTFGAGEGAATGVVVEPDGDVVVAGDGYSAGTPMAAGLAWFKSAGTPDPALGAGGVRLLPDPGGSIANVWGLGLQTDGKLVLSGTVFAVTGEAVRVIRVDSFGSPDASFGSGGFVTTAPFGSPQADGYRLAIQTDGGIVVAARAVIGGATRFVVLRYLPNGRLDASFGSGGQVQTTFGVFVTDEGAFGIALQPDKKIVAVGTTDPSGAPPEFAIARYRGEGPRRSGVVVIPGPLLAGSYSARIVCPPGPVCDGSFSAVPPPARCQRARLPRTCVFGSGRFRVAGGRETSLRLGLSRRGLAYVSEHRGGLLLVLVRSEGQRYRVALARRPSRRSASAARRRSSRGSRTSSPATRARSSPARS